MNTIASTLWADSNVPVNLAMNYIPMENIAKVIYVTTISSFQLFQFTLEIFH